MPLIIIGVFLVIGIEAVVFAIAKWREKFNRYFFGSIGILCLFLAILNIAYRGGTQAFGQ